MPAPRQTHSSSFVRENFVIMSPQASGALKSHCALGGASSSRKSAAPRSLQKQGAFDCQDVPILAGGAIFRLGACSDVDLRRWDCSWGVDVPSPISTNKHLMLRLQTLPEVRIDSATASSCLFHRQLLRVDYIKTCSLEIRDQYRILLVSSYKQNSSTTKHIPHQPKSQNKLKTTTITIKKMASSSMKLFVCLVLAALVACSMAQLIPISGSRDLTGGYYDHYTGQYSSAITGRVYNTAPAVVAGKHLDTS